MYYLLFLTITPYNYYHYLVAHVKAPSLLVSVVWTVSVSSSPSSSPTCDRAGTPAGPVRTDKILSCSHVCQKGF